MLTFTNTAPPNPNFPSASSVFFEAVVKEFLRNDLIGGQPTTCALPHKIHHHHSEFVSNVIG